MSKFTNYESGGGFDPITITDDSERILRQSEDLIKKQQVLGEYKSKQSAALANNLNIEFERQKRSEDLAYQRRQKQLEINYKIKEREGQAFERAAMQQASINDAYDQKKDAERMQAIGTFFETASDIGTNLYQGAIDKAKEAGAAAGANPYQDQVDSTSRAIDPLLDAAPPPASEYVGQAVRDGIGGTVFVAQANEDRLQRESGREPYSGFMSRALGLDKVYRSAKIQEQAIKTGETFPAYVANALQEGTPLTLNINGIDQQVPYGSAEMRNNIDAQQEALTQLSLKLFKEKGYDKYDPVLMKGYFDKVSPFIQGELNKTAEQIGKENVIKQRGIATANFATSTKDKAAVDILVTQLTSVDGVSQTKTTIKELVKNQIIPTQVFKDYVQTGRWFTTSAPIAQTDELWVKETLQAAESQSRTNRQSAIELQKEEIFKVLDEGIIFSNQDGIVTKGDTAEIKAKLAGVFPSIFPENLEAINTRLTSQKDYRNELSRNARRKLLDDKLASKTLTTEDLLDARGILEPKELNDYLSKIRPGGEAATFDKDQKEEAEKEVTGIVNNLLGVTTTTVLGDKKALSSRDAAKRELMRSFEGYYRQAAKQFPPDKAFEQARIDLMKYVDANRGNGQLFGVTKLEVFGAQGGKAFPSFLPNSTFPKFGPLSWNVKQYRTNYGALASRIKNGTVDINTEPRIIREGDIDTIEKQIISGQNITIPTYVYRLSADTGKSVEELINGQLNAYGKGLSLNGNSPFTAVVNAQADSTIRAWLPTHPTQQNVQTAVALGGHLPESIDVGPVGFQQMIAAANSYGSQFPTLVASMWAGQTQYGNKTLFITDDNGTKVRAKNPAEFIAWADSEILMQKSEGQWIEGATFEELHAANLLGKLNYDVLQKEGLLGTKPGDSRIKGASNALQMAVVYETGSMTHGVESQVGEHLHMQFGDNPETPDIDERGAYIDQHNKLINESIMIETKKGSNQFMTPSEWVEYTDSIGFPETPEQRYGAPRDGGSRKHLGYDFRSQAGSKIKITNGARVVDVVRGTSNGDIVYVRLKDGTIVELYHGKYTGTKY